MKRTNHDVARRASKRGGSASMSADLRPSNVGAVTCGGARTAVAHQQSRSNLVILRYNSLPTGQPYWQCPHKQTRLPLKDCLSVRRMSHMLHTSK